MVSKYDMFQRMARYFQDPTRIALDRHVKITDVACMVDLEFASDRLASANRRWTEAYQNQEYSSPFQKDLELDSCRESYDFWHDVVKMKTPNKGEARV